MVANKNEKLLIRMQRNPIPNNISMHELDRFLRSRGFTLHSQRSAHLNYKHQKLNYILTIDSHDMKQEVKVIYIKNVLIALEEIEKLGGKHE